MIKIAPSILSANFGTLAIDVEKVEKAGAELLHIDVMDGHFVPNITIGPLVVEALRPNSKMVFDVHLMIENPDNYISQFAKAGADIITVHAEACRHLNRTIQNIKSHNVRAAVALNPATQLEVLDYVIDDIDMILLMSVNPGFGGQKFIKNTIDKLEKLRHKLNGRQIDIQVDGGVNLENLAQIIKAGANVIVAGSAIFNSNDIEKTIKEFKIIGNKSMKATVIANGEFADINQLKKEVSSSEYTICADGGGTICFEHGIIPNYLMGDFDSINNEFLNYFKEKGSEIIKFPAEKDFTDTEICIHKALELGCNEICIIAGVGGRIDHSIGNIWLLHYVSQMGAKGYIISKDNTVYLCNDCIELDGKIGDIVSIFPLAEDAYGITTSGLKYPLNDAKIKFGRPIGVSNELVETKCRVEIKSGEILVIKQNI